MTELEALARAATPGNWTEHLAGPLAANDHIVVAECGYTESGVRRIETISRVFALHGAKVAAANAAFIAAANPTAVLALLSELDTLSAKNKALAERVAGLEEGLREIATFGAGYGFSAPTDIATFCQRRARTLITGADAMLAARTQESSK